MHIHDCQKCHKIFCNQLPSPLWCLISFWGLLVNGWTCFSTPYIFLANMITMWNSDDLLSPVCDFQPTNSGKRAASIELILPHLVDSVVPLPLSHNHNITQCTARTIHHCYCRWLHLRHPTFIHRILSPMYNQYSVICLIVVVGSSGYFLFLFISVKFRHKATVFYMRVEVPLDWL